VSGQLDEAASPRFAPGVRLRFDEARDVWVVLAPERMFLPDDVALEVLKLVDGARTLGGIADELSARFEAPRQEILADVKEMLADFAAKGALIL
jgi:pyrroloquinoline quinone biosynthesis protein D